MKALFLLLIISLPAACFCKESKNDSEKGSQSKSSEIYNEANLDQGSLNGQVSDANSKASKKKTAFLLDVFSGYNFYFGKFFIGLEGGVTPIPNFSKPKLDNKVYNLKREFSFEASPKFGYDIFNSFRGYLKFGASISSYKLHTSNKTTNPTKSSLLVGIGIEKAIGSLFIKGEINKVFKRKIKRFNETNFSAGSYSFKIGGGYRF